MAIAYIAEYTSVPTQGGDRMPVPMEPAIATQTVDFTAGVTPSAAFNAVTKYVVIILDTAAHGRFGENPTATTSHPRFPADQPIDRGVLPGDKVSFLAA